MNCKPGDLAILVESSAGNEGKVVLCVRLSHHQSLTNFDGSKHPGIVWEIEPPLPAWDGSMSRFALDSCLRPIRDPGDDAADESKAWLPPVPTKEHV